MQIITNNKPRFTIDYSELTERERVDFDYCDSGTFFRYRGATYDLGEFMPCNGAFAGNWHGYTNDTYFSGILIRLSNDGESVIVARFYS